MQIVHTGRDLAARLSIALKEHTVQIRPLIAAAAVLLCLGAFVAAQDLPITSQADTVTHESSGRTTMAGNVVLTVNGVVVRADRAVIQDGEVRLEGNVRLTLPKPAYTPAAMRDRIRTR